MGGRECGILHGVDDFLLCRESVALSSHFFPINGNREFAMIAVDHLHVETLFLAECCRQTGGKATDGASDRALTDRYLLHRNSLLLNRDEPTDAVRCRLRANSR